MTHLTNLKFRGRLERLDKNRIRYIVVHHSEVQSRHTIADIHQWHLNKGWAGIGYHFFIDREGSVHNGRPLWAKGAHTYGYNNVSIGICLEGDFNKQQPAEKQIESAALLITMLSRLYKGAAIVRHSDLTEAKNCPGKFFPFKSLCHRVTQHRQFLGET